ncbi:MAG: PKD domain-containing protein [Bacteroidia bacterium]|nr:PKD domain-containing protein [Bacteroidia bacterium]
MNFLINRTIFVLCLLSFFSLSGFSVILSPHVSSTNKVHGTHDIALKSKRQVIDGCLGFKYQPEFWVHNLSTDFVDVIPVSIIFGTDTTVERHGVYLNPSDSIRLKPRTPFTALKTGISYGQILYDSTDNDVNNNALLFEYHIEEAPEANFTFSDVCDGDEFWFINTSSYSGPDKLRPQWRFASAANYGLDTVPYLFRLAKPGVTESFQVTLVVFSKGCKDSTAKVATVHANPDPSFDYRIDNRELVVTNVVTRDPAYLYTWDLGDGTQAKGSNPSHTYPTDDDYEVCLTVWNPAGCVASTCNVAGPTARMEGRVFVDLNNNCRYDSSDQIFDTRLCANGSNTTRNVNEDGKFEWALLADQNYFITSKELTSLEPSCDTDTFLISNAVEDSTYVHDFIFKPKSGLNDLSIDVGNHLVRRGRRCNVYMRVKSIGFGPLDSIEVDLTFDSSFTFMGSVTPYKVIKKNHVRFKIKRPAFLKEVYINAVVHDVSGQLTRGEVVQFTGQLLVADDNSNNNHDTSRSMVMTPYDPNIKTSYPSGGIEARVDEIRYIVEFQNIGNTDAKDVVVYDYLDSLLPSVDMEVTATSHPDQFSMSVRNNQVKWTFKDIFLPDSASDPEGSKGFVAYKIKVAPGFKLPGDTINNKATIYFDFEDGIVTNTASVYIEDLSSIREKVERVGYLAVYPNPANSYLVAENQSSKEQSVVICDLKGSEVKSFDIEPLGQKSVDVSDLLPGVYLLRDGEGNSLKFLKH